MWTLEDLITEVWEQIGKPSDITPLDLDGNFDINLEGTQQLRRWINWGQREICTWKFGNGELVRFGFLYRNARFQTKAYTVTASAYDDTTGTITLDAPLPAWLQKSHLATKRLGRWTEVLSVSDTELKPITDIEDFPLGDFDLMRREYYFIAPAADGADENIPLDPVSEIDSVQRITDLKYGRKITRGERTEYWPGTANEQGPPAQYSQTSNSIVFDRLPEDKSWFALEYYGLPHELVEATDYPELPAQFHEGLILHATWYGLRRQQEWSGAYSTKRDLHDYMRGRRKQFESSWDLSDGYLRVEH